MPPSGTVVLFCPFALKPPRIFVLLSAAVVLACMVVALAIVQTQTRTKPPKIDLFIRPKGVRVWPLVHVKYPTCGGVPRARRGAPGRTVQLLLTCTL